METGGVIEYQKAARSVFKTDECIGHVGVGTRRYTLVANEGSTRRKVLRRHSYYPDINYFTRTILVKVLGDARTLVVMMDRLFANTVTSAASAEESRLLADIKAIETQHVAAAITQMAASVAVAQTRDSQVALGKISQEVGAINAMNAQIASASVQQSAAAEEVAQNVTRIHSSTVQSAAGSEQVENSNHELAELADRLSTKVAFFNVA